jgi:ABC-2 type transport system permease protein
VKAVIAVFWSEFRRIFALRPAFSVLVLANVVYAIFYPQPYVNEALRDVPVALVDQDGTTSSRELARRIDATSDVAIATVVADLPTAERAVFERTIHGIIVIPQYFERDLLHGRPSPIALYADASYFLIYQRVSGAVSAVARQFGTEVETDRLIGIGVDPALAVAAADPLLLTAVPLFNPQGGYATYILPAALVLILQQTLLMGVGLLRTLPLGAAGANGPDATAGALTTIFGRLLAYLALETAILPLYLIGLPYLYGVPRLGSSLTILFFAVPFVLSVGALGLLLAAIFRKPIAVQLVMGAIGLPLFFLAGFTWPSEAIPQSIRLVSTLVPSTSAIDGFVKLSQLGASLPDVRAEFLTLWALAACYGGIAVLLETRRNSSPSPANPFDLERPIPRNSGPNLSARRLSS